MLKFILNNELVQTELPPGMTLLDFIRYHQDLKGTKIGCREGDCGACSVLVGEEKDGKMEYKSITSCVTPIGNVAGKHVVTVEGLNMDDLSPVQGAMVQESGTQCGFCTVGFVVSFTALCFSHQPISYADVISGIDGNICRCTGYKSIERAAERIHSNLQNRDLNNPVRWLVEHNYIPSYFSEIQERLNNLKTDEVAKGNVTVGGGTDLYVQKHEEMEDESIYFISKDSEYKGIKVENGICTIGSATTATELMDSKELQTVFPNLYKHLKLVSSTPIRNIGTIAGNFVNASPIGDLTAFFIALNSSITLAKTDRNERTILLRDVYKGYKILDKEKEEIIASVSFPVNDFKFNFEKVSKRTYLDIASVNSAISIKENNGVIEEIHVSAGGVGPTPLHLTKTCDFLKGKEINKSTIEQAVEVIQTEVAPISDARGTEEYKRLLLKQLFFAHFVELYPETFKEEVLV